MMANPKKILITGSSGYVGQHLIASLGFGGISSEAGSSTTCDAGKDEKHTQQQYELYCAYNSLPTFDDDLDALLEQSKLHPSVSCIRPISNIDFSTSDYIDVIQQTCGEVDAIVHLAALSSPGYCEKNASVAWKVNCPVDLLKFNAPIIYMSTDQVYEGRKQYYREDVETIPVNVYGRTKLAFERVLLRTESIANEPLLNKNEMGCDSYSIQCMPDVKSIDKMAHPKSVILRSSLILGPNTPLKNGCKKGAFPSFLQFIESRLQSATPTDYFINEFRSVVYIEDVVRSIKHFLNVAIADDDSAKKVEVYNLGGSTRASRYDIALDVAKRLDLDDSSANGVNRPETGGGVPSPPDISMNVDKLTKELGVEKMHGLKDIVDATFK